MSKRRGIFKDIIKEFSGKRRSKLMESMKDSPMTVTISGSSPEAVKEGAEMVGDMMEGEDSMGDMMDKAMPSKKESYAEARKKSLKKNKKS